MTQSKKDALVNSTTDTFKKFRLRERTDRAWFSRLVRHPARKRSGSILTIPEPAQGVYSSVQRRHLRSSSMYVVSI